MSNTNVVIVPITEDGRAVMVRQYEFPSGGCWTADKEYRCRDLLYKEVGVEVGEVRPIGVFEESEGEVFHVFMGLQADVQNLKEEGRLVELPELKQALRDGEVWSGVSLAAYALLRVATEQPPVFQLVAKPEE